MYNLLLLLDHVKKEMKNDLLKKLLIDIIIIKKNIPIIIGIS